MTGNDITKFGVFEGVDQADRLDLSNVIPGQYHRIALNENGISWIDKVNPLVGTDNTKGTLLGLREGHDLLNNQIAHSVYTISRVFVRFSEDAGINSDPYLEVTYQCDESEAPPVGGNVISVTPIGPQSLVCAIAGDIISMGSIEDLDGNGAPEILLLGIDAGNAPVVCIKDALSGEIIDSLAFFVSGWTPKTVRSVPDMSSPLDGAPDISVLAVNGTVSKTQIIDSMTGELIKEMTLP